MTRSGDDVMPHVAVNIRAARKAQGFTQEGLARVLDVASGTVFNWERGLSWPRRRDLPALAAALGRDPEWFFVDHAPERREVAA